MPNDSLRAAAQAATSPRVWAVVVALSGWLWTAAVWIAQSPTRAELDALKLEASKQETKQEARISACEAVQLQAREQSVLAVRALVGQIARERARGARRELRDNEQAAAERRFDAAMLEVHSAAQAARLALQP